MNYLKTSLYLSTNGISTFKIVVLLLLIVLFASCVKEDKTIPSGEKFYLMNKSDYSVQVIGYDQGAVFYDSTMATGERRFVNKGSTSNPNHIDLTLDFDDMDSVIVLFDSMVKLKSGQGINIDRGDDSHYIPSSCRYYKKKMGCTRTFSITNEHYLKGDTL